MRKKGCEKKYMRDYMRAARNKRYYEKTDKRYNKRLIKIRYELKEKAIEYKGRVCSRCGGTFDSVCMDFHHTDYTQKDFNLSVMFTLKTWNAVKKELDKTILVCSNCHRIIHKEEKYTHLKDKREVTQINFQISLF